MKKITKKTGINSILGLLFILPLYWTIVTSLKGKTEIYATPPSLIPKAPTLENYTRILTLENGIYREYFINSLVVTAVTILLTVVISVLAGYGLSKLKLKGGRVMLACILATIMIPFQALLNPLYMIMAKLHLLNTVTSLILIYTTFHSPFCIYMMKKF